MTWENEVVHSSNAWGSVFLQTQMYNTGTGIKAFARFMVGAPIEQEFEAVPSLKDSFKDKKKRAEYEVEKLKQLLFLGVYLKSQYLKNLWS